MKKNFKKILKEIKYFAIVFFIFNTVSGIIILTILPKDKLVSLLTNYKRLSKDLISEKDAEIYQNQNIKKLLNINNKEDISYKRKQLINNIYGTSRISKLSNVNVKDKINDEKYLDLTNLKFIDKVTINMDYGIKSIAYKFVPHKKNNKLLIYHQGHLGDFYIGKNTINYFLSKGYEVIAFAMPTIGLNSKPTIFINNIGNLKIDSHDKLKFLEHKDNSSSLKFFTLPISGFLDKYLEKNNFESISMVGISGGGWTTTLVSALDTRINYSFPVAGSLPIFLRRQFDFLDSENWDYDLYHEINYLHLYALGSISQKNSKRLSLKILNKYDECCFSGNRYEYFYPKLKNILDKIEENRFQIFIDDSHSEHKISQETLEIIHNKILMEDQKK